MEFSGYQLLPYDCYFDYLTKYDPEIRQWILYLQNLREIGITSTSLLLADSSHLSSSLLSTRSLKSSSSVIHIIHLPMECMLNIFSFLDSRSLCRSQATCSEWNKLTSLDFLWKDLCVLSFHSSPEAFLFKKSVSMKQMYAAMHQVKNQTLHPKPPNPLSNMTIPAIFWHFS
jgi:hypothetical protein